MDKKALNEDNINHPKHYETDKVECIEAMEITQGKGAVMSFCLCNAFKYLWRRMRKNGLEDVKKARWYLDKYIELAEKESIPVCKELKEERYGVKGLDSVDISADAARLAESINFMDAPKELKDAWFMEMMNRASNNNSIVEDFEDLFRTDEE